MNWLAPYWEEAEEFKIGEHYDVIIYQKVYWENMIRNFKGIQILDLCDPDWLDGRDVFKIIDLVDAVTTSSEALRDYILKLRPKKIVRWIPDRIKLDEHKPREKHEGIAKKVVWFGYSHNLPYIYKTFDHLIKRNLELIVISDQPMQVPTVYQSLKVTEIPYSYPQVNEDIKRGDIIIMPEYSAEDGKARYKSNNKTLTGWALGVPVATTPEDLDRFVSPDERNKEAKERLKQIKEKWLVQQSVSEYKELINDLQHRKKD